MNKNSENYKAVYSAFRPSDAAMERVMNMTKENANHIHNLTRKGLVAAALALTLLVGAGFGVNRFAGKDRRSAGNDFGILIAGAADGEFRSVDDFAEGETLKINTERLHDIDDFDQYIGFEFDYLDFCPDVEDYSDVQSLRVRCENGNLHLSCVIPWTDAAGETFDQSVDKVSDGPDANEITVSGDEIRYSQNSERAAEEIGTTAGYLIEWNPHYDVVQAYSFGDGYDLTQVRDTITLTLTYTDGTEKTATMRFRFDGNGYLQFE